MKEEELKTSKEWASLKLSESGIIICDFDGWDRSNFEYSYNEELITFSEFNRRLMYSTIMIKL